MARKKKKQTPHPAGDVSGGAHFLAWVFPAVVFLHLLGLLIPDQYAWGFNYWRLVDRGLALGLLALALIVLLPPVTNGLAALTARFRLPDLFKTSRTGGVLLTTVGSVVLFLLFYHFRSRGLVYGDGFIILDRHTDLTLSFDLATDLVKPLAGVFHRNVYGVVSSLVEASPANILGGINAAGGVVGFWAVWRLAGSLAESAAARGAILLGALTSGAAVLFFGHIETYTWATSLALWCLYFSINHAVSGGRIWPAWLLGLLAVAFHFFAGPFLLAAALILWKGPKAYRWTKRAAAGVTLAAIVLALIFTIVELPPYLVPLLPLSINPYWFLSPPHLVDMVNIVILMAPLGIVAAIGLPVRRQKTRPASPIVSLLWLVSVTALTVAFWFDPALGAPRDWDVLSFFGFPLSLWAVYRVVHASSHRLWARRCLIGTLVLVPVVLVPNLMEKNDLKTATDRLDDILWKDPHYQPAYYAASRCLPWARTLLLNADSPDRPMKYYRRLAHTQPHKFKAWATLGERHYQLGNYDSAYVHLQHALTLEPNHAHLLYLTGTVETGLGKHEDALGHFRRAFRLEPDTSRHAIRMGMLMTELMVYDSAVLYLRRGLARPGKGELAGSRSEPVKPVVYQALLYSALRTGSRVDAEFALRELERIGLDARQLNLCRQQFQATFGPKD